jgi:hypothetical protein
MKPNIRRSHRYFRYKFEWVCYDDKAYGWGNTIKEAWRCYWWNKATFGLFHQ